MKRTSNAPVKDIASLADLQPDSRNANKHTERGVGMLEHSLRKYGAARSIVADRQGRIIAGSATLESAATLGLDVLVVRTRGDKLIVHQREDLDMEDEQNADARELAIADNRVAEVDLDWSAENLKALIKQETDLSAFFFDDELDDLLDPGKRREPVEFEAKKKACTCCKRKCRKSCGCYE